MNYTESAQSPTQNGFNTNLNVRINIFLLVVPWTWKAKAIPLQLLIIVRPWALFNSQFYMFS